jgi:hypothetical protein
LNGNWWKWTTLCGPLRVPRKCMNPFGCLIAERRLKTLKGLTPYEYICKCWTSQPERFNLNPLQKMPRLNN